MQMIGRKSAPIPKDAVLPGERRREILAKIAQDGRVVSRALSAEWGISEDTIRRDIRELHDAGLLHRVHGGALPRSAQLPPNARRPATLVDGNARLGRSAAVHIAHGMTALFYAGTAVLEAARQLRFDLRARIVTNDPLIALEASRRREIETILIGGRLAAAGLTLGSDAVDTVRSMRADVCLVGACALNDAFGLSIDDGEQAMLQRAFIEQSTAVIVLLTTDLLQTTAPFRVAPAAKVSRIIAAGNLPTDVIDRYRGLGIAIEAA